MVTRDASARYLLNLVLFVDAIPVKDLRSNCWPSVQSAESPDALIDGEENPSNSLKIHGKYRFLGKPKKKQKKIRTLFLVIPIF